MQKQGPDYITEAGVVTPDMIDGFFVGWPASPTPLQLVAVMESSYRRVWAVLDGRVVGYINAISDGVMNASIPWLEVHPAHQGRGIGSELVRRIVAELTGMYAIDLCCDNDLVPYYQRLGFTGLSGAGLRFPQAIAPIDAVVQGEVGLAEALAHGPQRPLPPHRGHPTRTS